MHILEWLCLPLLLIACYTDLQRREIPDWISFVLLGTALVASAFHWIPPLTLRASLVGGALGTAAGLALFHLLKFGGGDAKLLIALSAVLGFPSVVSFFLFTALWMGVTSAVAMLRGRKEAPYGPAIALAFITLIAIRDGWLLGRVV